MSKLEEAAENHVIHVSNLKYQCPACSEETMWKAATKDFKAGALWQAEQSKVLEDALEYYAKHETIIEEAYISQATSQLICVHSFINNTAIDALQKYRESK